MAEESVQGGIECSGCDVRLSWIHKFVPSQEAETLGCHHMLMDQRIPVECFPEKDRLGCLCKTFGLFGTSFECLRFFTYDKIEITFFTCLA